VSKKLGIVVGVCLPVFLIAVLLIKPVVKHLLAASPPHVIPGGLLEPATKTGKLKIGQAMPDLKLASLNGQDVKLSQLINKQGLTLITFISLGCPPCLQDLKILKEYYAELKARNVKVICVSGEGQEHLLEFTQKQALPFELFYDQNWVGTQRTCALPGTPYHVILAKGSMKVQWLVYGHVMLTDRGGEKSVLIMYLQNNS